MEDIWYTEYDEDLITNTTNSLIYCIIKNGLLSTSSLKSIFYLSKNKDIFYFAGFFNTINIFRVYLKCAEYGDEEIADFSLNKILREKLQHSEKEVAQFYKIFYDLYMYTIDNTFEDDNILKTILNILENIEKLGNFLSSEEEYIKIFMKDSRIKTLIDFCDNLQLKES